MPDNTPLLNRRGLDLDLAVLLARASEVAYNPALVIRAWAKDNGFAAHCQPFDHDNIQGFWCTANDAALLVFRGTSNIGQWLRDVRFFPVEDEWGRVHAGFKGGVDIAAPELGAFKAAVQQCKNIWITGHSLGGALAVMAAARLKAQGIKPSIYTYGQPRVGLSGFAARFDAELPDQLIRFINQSDIVPRVPPGLIYRHTGTPKHIRPGVLEAAGDELVEDEMPPLSEEQFAELQEQLNDPSVTAMEGVLPWLSDHSCTEYVRLLTEIRDAQ